MASEADTLKFYATLLRDEIKSADTKVSAAIASSSIILSANFLILRAQSVSGLASLIILVASASALLAMMFAIFAILPRAPRRSDALFYFGTTGQSSPGDLLARLSGVAEVTAGLAQLCHDYAVIISKKYRMVHTSLNFLMLSAIATAVAVLVRFLGEEPQALPGF